MNKELVREYYSYILGEMETQDFYNEMGLSSEESIPDNIDQLVDRRFENRWNLMDQDDKEY